MYPLLDWFGYKMGTFPICVGIGLASGVLFIFLQIKRLKVSPEFENSTMLAIPLTFICGTIGAHLTDVFLHAGWLGIIKTPFAYGLTFYGWLFSACIFLIPYSLKCHISPIYMLNLFCPAFAVGQAYGRIGCFLGGCCYGCPWQFGVIYPIGSLPYSQYGAIPLVPVQIFESVFLFTIFIILIKYIPFHRRGTWYLIMLSAGRFVLEFFRADDRGELFYNLLSPSQWISTGLFIIGICWLIVIEKKARKKNYNYGK